jgi:hypothetical protein
MWANPTASSTGREVDRTRLVAMALGVCVGVSGLDHGFFEALQGNTATPGLFVQAIGPAQRMWIYGTEDAFTMVPNFLLTGILAVIVGMLMIVWSIRYIDRPAGSRIFLLLGGLLFLVGGGVAMLVFLLFGWLVARRIHRPLAWVRPHLPGTVGRVLWKAGPGLVVVGLALYAVALEVAIVGVVPGVSDPQQALTVCWAALVGLLASMALAFIGASAAPVIGVSVRHSVETAPTGSR